MDERNLRAYFAELVGTFIFVFVSAAAVCISFLGGQQPGLVGIAFATGLIYTAMLAATVNISGGYLSPAITIMLWVFRRLDGAKTIGLLFAQLLGSVVAGLAVYGLCYFREEIALPDHLGAPQLNIDAVGFGTLGLIKGILVELLLSFALVIVLFGTILDPRAPRWTGTWGSRLACLWLGIALVAVTLIGYPITGAALNPVRWLGPAVWDLTQNPEAFHNHAVFWVGPIAGALLAGWAYTALILPGEEEQRTPATHTSAPAAMAGSVSSTLYRARK